MISKRFSIIALLLIIVTIITLIFSFQHLNKNIEKEKKKKHLFISNPIQTDDTTKTVCTVNASNFKCKDLCNNELLYLTMVFKDSNGIINELVSKSKLKMLFSISYFGKNNKSFNRMVYNDHFPNDTLIISNSIIESMFYSVNGVRYSYGISLGEIVNLEKETLEICIEVLEPDSKINVLQPRIVIGCKNAKNKDPLSKLDDLLYFIVPYLILLIILVIYLFTRVFQCTKSE